MTVQLLYPQPKYVYDALKPIKTASMELRGCLFFQGDPVVLEVFLILTLAIHTSCRPKPASQYTQNSHKITRSYFTTFIFTRLSIRLQHVSPAYERLLTLILSERLTNQKKTFTLAIPHRFHPSNGCSSPRKEATCNGCSRAERMKLTRSMG